MGRLYIWEKYDNIRWLFTFEAATSCAHRIKRIPIILRNCHKTRLVDLPLRESSGIKHPRVKRFLMVIAPSGKNRENVGVPMFPKIPPASDQWWVDHHRTRVFLCNSIVTSLDLWLQNSQRLFTGVSPFSHSPTYTLHTSVTIFFTRLLEIYIFFEVLIKCYATN